MEVLCPVGRGLEYKSPDVGDILQIILQWVTLYFRLNQVLN